MTAFTIRCPHPPCRQPLNVPSDAVGKPLSCPHCRTAIGLALGPDGRPTEPTSLGRTGWVPKMFLVPGFALLILGGAGAFVNGYVASDVLTHPGAEATHARRLVDDLRSFEGLTGAANEAKKKKGEPTPQDLFAAVAGQAARLAEEERSDAKLAEAWAPRILPMNLTFAVVSLVAAAGGWAIIRGRWYWLALVGCVAAVLNLNAGCCVPGGIAGIWGFLMLVRDEGRKHFGR